MWHPICARVVTIFLSSFHYQVLFSNFNNSWVFILQQNDLHKIMCVRTYLCMIILGWTIQYTFSVFAFSYDILWFIQFIGEKREGRWWSFSSMSQCSPVRQSAFWQLSHFKRIFKFLSIFGANVMQKLFNTPIEKLE